MRNYEMMFIVKTTLEEAAVKNTVKEFSLFYLQIHLHKALEYISIFDEKEKN